MRQLTLLQRQRVTLSLFFTVALGAVFTVAAPAFVPWQVVDNKRAQALDQQRKQGKDFHVVENHHSRRAGNSPTTSDEEPNASPATPSTLSHQGMIIPLLTDRSKLQPSLGSEVEAGQVNEPSIQQADGSTSEPTKKKRRRRRKRTMVNEGWQELTGRTAREEKEKYGSQTDAQYGSEDQRSVVGENGGKEISWSKQT